MHVRHSYITTYYYDLILVVWLKQYCKLHLKKKKKGSYRIQMLFRLMNNSYIYHVHCWLAWACRYWFVWHWSWEIHVIYICTFLVVSLVNSTHHIQLNWQSNRTGMLCCFCALLSLLLLISAAFLFALWVLSGVYCMWGAKGFLVGNTSPTPHPTPPLPPPPNPLTEITPKKRTTKKKLDEIHPYLHCLRLKSSGIKEMC